MSQPLCTRPQIVVAGHSASATLALSALLELRDAGSPMPAAAVALSPITDFTLSGKSIVGNDGKDVITLAEARHVAAAYLASADPGGAPQSLWPATTRACRRC
jgi:virginiamycin B lyase